MVMACKSEAEFKQILAEHAKVMVDFHATWCGPCKRIAPEVEKLAKAHPSIYFIKIDVDEVQVRYLVSPLALFCFSVFPRLYLQRPSDVSQACG